MGEPTLYSASFLMIDFALSHSEVAIQAANEQIKMSMLFPLKGLHGAKVVNISETPKKWEDFLISEPLYNKE